MRPTLACVAVGSNVDPLVHVPRGLRRLDQRAPIVAASRFHWTPAVGPDGEMRPQDPRYLNGMVQVHTALAPLALRRLLRDVEAAAGRVRVSDRYAPRTLDLDLTVHSGRVMDADLPFRRHVAVPLLEIDPAFEVLPGTPLRDPGGLPMTPAEFSWPMDAAALGPRHPHLGDQAPPMGGRRSTPQPTA